MKRQSLSDIKVAWLIPSMARGFVWEGLLERFSKTFPKTAVFTGQWPANRPKDNVDFNLNVIGKTRFLTLNNNSSNYSKGIIMPPLGISLYLLRYMPNVVFVYGFSLWTLISLLLKPFTRWRVIIVYEGSSPTVDAKESKIRVYARTFMSMLSDAFVTNSNAGRDYLVQFLKAKREHVFVRPYGVSDKKYLSLKKVDVKTLLKDAPRPVFLYAGLLIERKGIKFLLEALAALKREGCDNFTLMVVGDGPQREELEHIVREEGMEKQVKLMGWVDYNSLGYFFDASDVFVFPTYEDTWGLVVLEAMIFAKPVLCSELAGAMEMVKNGDNGFTFNPLHDKPQELSGMIRRFIDDPNLISVMGKKSKKMALSHTPEIVANDLKYIIEFVLGRREGGSIEFKKYQQEQT